jgi:hypothetical protein
MAMHVMAASRRSCRRAGIRNVVNGCHFEVPFHSTFLAFLAFGCLILFRPLFLTDLSGTLGP